jgi:hypothetical protein
MDVSSAMDIGVGVGGGASAITEGSAVEGEGEGEGRAWEGAVRGAGEEQFVARGVRDAGRKEEDACGGGHHGRGVVRPVDALRPPLSNNHIINSFQYYSSCDML